MLEQPISFRTSDTILFGNNAIDQVQEIIKTMNAKRILVITDKGIVRCGLINRLSALLQPFRYTVYDDIEETPDIETIAKDTMILGPGYVKKNPRPASEQDLLQILRNAFQGS